MSMIAVNGTAVSITLYLTLASDGSAATGLTFSDVTCDLKKSGGSFAPKTLDGTNFTEISGGFYELDLAATDTDVDGNLYVRVQGGTIDPVLETVFVTSTAPTTSAASSQSVSLVNLFGYVYGPDGTPSAGASVSARILATPSILHPGEEGLLISSGLTTVKTDSSGYFILPLIVGSDVDVFIPSANYRRTISVPNSSQNLFDIP